MPSGNVPVHHAQEYIQRLIEFGAVYYCPIHPLPPQQLAADTPAGRQQLAAAQAARLAGAARHGKSVRASLSSLNLSWCCAGNGYKVLGSKQSSAIDIMSSSFTAANAVGAAQGG